MGLAFSWTLFLQNSALGVHIMYGRKCLLHLFNLEMQELHLRFCLMTGMTFEKSKTGSFKTWLNINMSEILFDQMLKLFTVSVKSLIDNLLLVWYKKLKTFLEQIHYLPNLIVTIIEKNWFLPPPLQKFLWCFPVFTCSLDLNS